MPRPSSDCRPLTLVHSGPPPPPTPPCAVPAPCRTGSCPGLPSQQPPPMLKVRLVRTMRRQSQPPGPRPTGPGCLRPGSTVVAPAGPARGTPPVLGGGVRPAAWCLPGVSRMVGVCVGRVVRVVCEPGAGRLWWGWGGPRVVGPVWEHTSGTFCRCPPGKWAFPAGGTRSQIISRALGDSTRGRRRSPHGRCGGARLAWWG